MKVFEAVANALDQESVTDIFGLMGDGNLRFLTYWTGALGNGYYGTRHEAAAIGMADGYARASGRVGVCTVTQGPGLTNSLTALVTARKAGSPVLLLAGDVAGAQKGWPQDIDQDAVFAAAGVPVVRIADPATPYADIVRAYRLAATSGGPVGVDLPIDVQEMDWDAWDDEPVTAADRPSPSPPDATVREAAELLAGSRRPVVIAGRGAVEAGCEAGIVAVADRIGALVATTLRGKGLFGRHPFNLGIAGGLGTNLCAQLVGEADTALVVGAGMNDFTTMRQTLLRESADVVNCDLAPRGIGRPAGRLVELGGDAADVVPRLVAELDRLGAVSVGYRTPEVAATLADFVPQSELVLSDGDGYLDPRALTVRLDDVLPADRVVVTDAGHFFGNPCTYMRVTDPRSFVCGIDFGSIGLGLGHALGASVAHPGRPVVLFAGDGGLQMSLGDLETAVRYRVPLVVVVMNDAAYGSELQILRLWQLPEALSVFPPTDFAAVATALGARGLRVRSLADVDQLAGLDLGEGPVVVDCAISRDVRAAWLDEAFSR
ncbi:MAG TPA: thiamine pyrophosphate-binding protein [Acidimicrobiales bacterium]|nr:thiamine pyrophosphate-binding protein [Acidimicrobiales bacterium]